MLSLRADGRSEYFFILQGGKGAAYVTMVTPIGLRPKHVHVGRSMDLGVAVPRPRRTLAARRSAVAHGPTEDERRRWRLDEERSSHEPVVAEVTTATSRDPLQKVGQLQNGSGSPS